jgi:hypothetical protein
MKKSTLIMCACIAIAGNLLVPECVVVHKACCYDENGQLLADDAIGCKERSSLPVISGPDCCAPREYQLRSTPPSDSVLADVNVPHEQPLYALTPVEHVGIAALNVTKSLSQFSYDTGPPDCGLLTLHSRLNL